MSSYEDSVTSSVEQETGETSSWATERVSRKSRGSETMGECIACTEVQYTVQVPCQHYYCRTCVTRLVSAAMRDESLFPPKCCGKEMPLSVLRPYITDALTTKYEQRAIEFGTPCRTYCCSCEIFISPESIKGNQGNCTACNLDTCMLCKGQFHSGDCPEDPALERVLQLAQAVGWQRCIECQNMIERRDGCNHMT